MRLAAGVFRVFVAHLCCSSLPIRLGLNFGRGGGGENRVIGGGIASEEKSDAAKIGGKMDSMVKKSIEKYLWKK